MSTEENNNFDKGNLRKYLAELGKEYRKLSGKQIPAEIILIGGASIVANYSFRNMTTDVDALIYASSAMRDAISRVADKFSLPHRWLNEDFKYTESSSIHLREHSEYYATFSNILEVRTIRDEFLIAMKLRSGRLYKHDLSDVIGIIDECEKNLKPLTKEQIISATNKLYGDFNELPQASQVLLDQLFQNPNLHELYEETVKQEQRTQRVLLKYQEKRNKEISEASSNELIKYLEEL